MTAYGLLAGQMYVSLRVSGIDSSRNIEASPKIESFQPYIASLRLIQSYF